MRRGAAAGTLAGLALVFAALAFPPAAAHAGEPVVVTAALEFALDGRGTLSATYDLALLGWVRAGERIPLPPGATGASASDGSGRVLPTARDADGALRFLADGDANESRLWVSWSLAGASATGPLRLPHIGAGTLRLTAPNAVSLDPRLAAEGEARPADREDRARGARIWEWDLDALSDGSLRLTAPAPPPGELAWRLTGALGLVAALSLVAVAACETRVPRATGRKMKVLEHLEEVRWRIVAIGASLFAGLLVFFGMGPHAFRLAGARVVLPWPALTENYAADALRLLAAHTVPDDVRLVVTGPFEALGAEILVALLLSALVAIPIGLLEAYRFLRPGLYERERRWFLRSIPLVLLLFVAGALFAAAWLVPLLTRILYSFAAPLGAEPLLSLGAFLHFAALTMLTLGLAFELPPVMAGASAIGLVAPRTWLKYWRHAVVAGYFLAALAADPTLLTQVVVGTLLAALYFAGVGLSLLVARRPAPPA